MKTTHIENKAIAIDILREAKQRIARGDNRHVCIAVNSVVWGMTTDGSHKDNYRELSDTHIDLVVWIHKLLGRNQTLQNWLRSRKVIKRSEFDQLYYGYTPLQDQLKLCRLAWIEWMISELEAIK